MITKNIIHNQLYHIALTYMCSYIMMFVSGIFKKRRRHLLTFLLLKLLNINILIVIC